MIGVLVGLPALRLSGLYLALITLMLAGAITIVLVATDFPNGGGGFLGHTDSSVGTPPSAGPHRAQRPGLLPLHGRCRGADVPARLWHLCSKAGRAWAAIRQSEPSALSTGINITLYKLWAFALASFMTGVAGGLLAAYVGKLYYYAFPTQDSVILLAVVLMGGVYSLWGAIVAGMLMKLLPAILDIWRINPNVLVILFGVGVLQVLLTAPGGLVDQFPKDMRKLGRLIVRRRRARRVAG